jgi:hypothetical protein
MHHDFRSVPWSAEIETFEWGDKRLCSRACAEERFVEIDPLVHDGIADERPNAKLSRAALARRRS